MRFETLSAKQKWVFAWPHREETRKKYDSIICEGSIRSGKTVCMASSFIFWAMSNFNNQAFAICGKTIASVERNIITPLQAIENVTELFTLKHTRSKGYMTVTGCGKKNYFYIFGGKDESSAALIQGMTLAGVLLDEVALMPRSFVEQALARCSVAGSTSWFNCNPESPNHWFKTEWVDKAEEKHALRLHFMMQDNPSLSRETIEKYERRYEGVFYERFILGLWKKAEGLVYPMFGKNQIITRLPKTPKKAAAHYYISIDYGTVNPTSMGLWRVCAGTAVRVKEDYYNSRKEQGGQLTDEEYYRRLEKLAGDLEIESVIVDPSAASFISCIRRHGRFSVRKANNDVINGIRYTATLLKSGKVKIMHCCADAINEFGLYSWDEEADQDRVIKENDHAMDDIRYFCYTILRHFEGFGVPQEEENKMPERGWI